MNETNIGSGSSQSPTTNLVDTFLKVPVSGGIPASLYVSSIEKSDQEAMLRQSIAGIPVLVAPDLALLNVQIEMSKISIEVLKAWGDSIEKEAQLVKELINSPAYLAKQEELHKIAYGTDKVQNVEATNSVSSKVNPSSVGGTVEDGQGLQGINNASKIDIVDKYAWLQFMGAVITATTIIEANLSKNEQDKLGVVAASGSAVAAGAFGVQNSQAVQDAQGNIVGVREVPPQDKINNVDRFDKTDNYTSVDETELTEPKSTGAAQFFGQALLIGASEVVLFQSGIAVANIAAVNAMHTEGMIIQNVWDAVSMKAADQASLVAGWFSALWGIGLLYQTSAEKMATYGGDKAKDSAAMNMDFAKVYAEKMLGNINSPQFIASLQAALAKSAPEGSQSLDTLVAKAKLTLLSLSLGLLAKLEVGSHKDEGWINELDFAGLLNGDTDITQNDLYGTASLKRSLISQINLLLSELDPKESTQIKSSLLSFMSTNPSLEDMLDQQGAFETILNQPSFEKGAFGKTPV